MPNKGDISKLLISKMEKSLDLKERNGKTRSQNALDFAKTLPGVSVVNGRIVLPNLKIRQDKAE